MIEAFVYLVVFDGGGGTVMFQVGDEGLGIC